MQGGDDLDDFVFDDIVALSGGEEDNADDTAAFFSDAEVDTEIPQTKAEEGRSSQNSSEAPPVVASSVIDKKRKRREKEKEKKAKKRKIIEALEEGSSKTSITERPPSELAEYLSAMQAKTFSKMSVIELGDMKLPEASIADTTTWTEPRTLDNLVNFIIKAVPVLHTRLSQKSKSNGSPTLLFITAAALRVADVTRVLKDKRLRGEKGGEVAKLFAKHFKLSEHVTYLKRAKIGSAVGTPGRIGKLLCETDALTVSALSHIVLDVTFRDSKNRGLLDIPETRDEVFKTVLGEPRIFNAIKEGKIQLVLF